MAKITQMRQKGEWGMLKIRTRRSCYFYNHYKSNRYKYNRDFCNHYKNDHDFCNHYKNNGHKAPFLSPHLIFFHCFYFLFQPPVQPFIPVQMEGELIAAPFEADALCVFPLFVAGRAAGGGGESIPDVPAGAGPVGASVGLPAAFRAFYFEVVGHRVNE